MDNYKNRFERYESDGSFLLTARQKLKIRSKSMDIKLHDILKAPKLK